MEKDQLSHDCDGMPRRTFLAMMSAAGVTMTGLSLAPKLAGAEVVIDYRKEDFADVLRDYDVVLNSLDKVTLEKSLRVLKRGGQLISISGPPDAAFARTIGASWVLRMVMGALSRGKE